MFSVSESALEGRARRAAKRTGLMVSKSRWRRGSIDNRGGFLVLDPRTNIVVCGFRFDLSAADIIELCSAQTAE
jgi:hypothetical protein